MSPTSELSPKGQFFEEELKLAWSLLDDKPEEANAIAQKWLMETSLSDIHRAGFHLLLSYPPDNQHAQKALELYNGLYRNPLDTVTPWHRKNKNLLVGLATKAVERAQADRLKYPVNAYDEKARAEDIKAMQEAEEDDNAGSVIVVSENGSVEENSDEDGEGVEGYGLPLIGQKGLAPVGGEAAGDEQ
ncbi:hypothetical protein LTR27_003830 [Elasticomyces elasticus]|nr:hypothetical protein LTR27_003830 [Elasticomyces elasticus]